MESSHRLRLPSPAAVVFNAHLRRAIRSFGTEIDSSSAEFDAIG